MSQALSLVPTTRWTSNCSTQGSVGSKVNSGGTHEQRNFGKVRRAFGGKASQPRVVAVAEADAVGVLDQFDAVEDPAADVGGALEGVTPRSRDDERLLAGLQPAGQAVVAVVAEQAAADGRHRDIGDVEVDEGVVRIALFRMRGGGGDCRIFAKALFTSSTERISRRTEPSPTRLCQSRISPLPGSIVFDSLRRRAGGDVALTAEPAALDQLGRGADDAVAHHQDGDRRATDDIDLRRGRGSARDAVHVGADQLVDGLQNAFFRNAQRERWAPCARPA